MKEDRLYYKKRLYRSELVTETSWADRFMLKSSGLKLPCLLVYGETVMKSRASAGGFDQQGYSFNLVTGGEGVFHIGGIFPSARGISASVPIFHAIPFPCRRAGI